MEKKLNLKHYCEASYGYLYIFLWYEDGVYVIATHVCEWISNKMKVWFTWIDVVKEAMSDYNIVE
jgi:hypothetical protein